MRHPLVTTAAALSLALSLAACAGDEAGATHPAPCTPAWQRWVEDVVGTGDGRGHGPDPGSDEWRSVVEFRLGIRGDPAVPDRRSEDWCAFIDRLVAGEGVQPSVR